MSKQELRRAYEDAEARLRDWRKDRASEETLRRLEQERDVAFHAMFEAGA